MSGYVEKPSRALPAGGKAAEAEPAKAPPTLKEFLEKYPPDVEIVVAQRASGPHKGGGYPGHLFFRLLTPELDLHCEHCEGTRAFKNTDEYAGTLSSAVMFDELNYECKNCKDGNKFRKRFCVAVIGEGPDGPVQKIGEYPAYNPVTSRKVFDLIGENHREMFLQGRRAELRGLGIGAFAYYRRIVDDQKNLIIDQLVKVAKRLGTSNDVLELFASAKAEDQFTNAIKKIKDTLPPALFISGHNPLTILYDILSDGIHDLPDEECLSHARTVRTLLIALADRISEISKDEAKVQEAIGAFLNRKKTK
jgi:hypothetical protein